MRKKLSVVSGVLALCLLIQGCGILPAPVEEGRRFGRVVTRVSVESLPADESQARVYTTPDKISAILKYVQALSLVKDVSGEPEANGGPTRKITVQYSGGGSKIYYMAGEDYLREGSEDWMRLETPPPLALDEILRNNPSDTDLLSESALPDSEPAAVP